MTRHMDDGPFIDRDYMMKMAGRMLE